MITQRTKTCPLAGALAERLRRSRAELTARWLERIAARVSLDANRVFPTDELLDHVPLLIDGIAAYLEDPTAEVSVGAPVVAKAMELGALRHAQGFDADEILKEYELLGGILFSYLADAADEMPGPCEKGELLVCGQRLFRAVALIQQATTAQYLGLADTVVAEREARLRAFNRSVSHEIRNRIGAVLGASEVLLEVDAMPEAERRTFLRVISENARAMQSAVENVLALSRTEGDARRQRQVPLAEAIREAARQVRKAARSAGVEVRVVGEVPDVEVNAAAVELALGNYLSNAIKYRDRRKAERRAEISARVEEGGGGGELVVRVRDNGLGVPSEERAHLFERFYRAHATVTAAEGTGLGLSIVRETVESLGGRAWAEFPEEETVFVFALPQRRAASPPDAERRASR